MKIVAVTRVLDEADIIEAFVRHTAAHVDHHLILDNGSRDGTAEILRALRDEGLAITFYGSASVSFVEEETSTFLFRAALRECGAHWVVFLDADEFIDDRGFDGGLAGCLKMMRDYQPLIRQVKVRLTDYIAIVHDIASELCVPARIQWRGEWAGNSKTIVSTAVAPETIMIGPGAHTAIWMANGAEVAPLTMAEGIGYAHYPERNTWQWLVKIVRGWAKILASGESNVARGVGFHYAEAFAALRDQPEAILYNQWVMGFKNERPGLVHDPLVYRGGPLRYTQPVDPKMHATRSLMGFIEDLARRHGQILEALPEARNLTRMLDQARERITQAPPAPTDQ